MSRSNDFDYHENLGYPTSKRNGIHYLVYQTWTSIHCHPYLIAKSNGIRYPGNPGYLKLTLTSIHFLAYQMST